MAHICPLWVGYFLANPMRKWIQDPENILSPHVKEGMTVLDIGCAMGFFSIPLAQMVGSRGKVICADIQEKMLDTLKKRAAKSGVIERIETVLCNHHTLNLNGFAEKIDFAFAFAVVHEVSEAKVFFTEIYDSLKFGATFLIAEPTAHVSKKEFRESILLAEQIGFKQIDMPKIPLSQAVVLEKYTHHDL